MIETLKPKILKNTLIFIILAEVFSFLGYYYPPINSLIFFLIITAVVLIALYRFEYGLYIILAELFIGSFGYLFYFEPGGLKISLRLALWLIIMSIWLVKTILPGIKIKKFPADFIKPPAASYFIFLAIFILWGLTNGFLNQNLPNNIFYDFNGWLYFLLILPLYSIFKSDQQIEAVKHIFLASIAWLSFKTLLLAYFFSHKFNSFLFDLYRWIRESGMGEVTLVQAGFSRIFMQSHIFILIGVFILLFYLFKKIVLNQEKKTFTAPLLLLALFLSAITISFSRSFWLGLIAGIIFVFLITIFRLKTKVKQFIQFCLYLLAGLILSLILTLIVLKFPLPEPSGGFNPAELFSKRATDLSEAGASSRWQLLNPLFDKIKTAPILGRGFGATVTYKTNDPRILESNPSGIYTTYAFEWGWLDVWLKLGFLGLMAYSALFIKIIKDGLKINSYLSLSLTVGLLVLMAVNIFSPYVNHPLGIGYLVITACLINYLRKT